MTKPRCNQICLEATSCYHITSRCVRRAFLCGIDEFSGTNYEHRREWIVERLGELSEIYCIEISAYAVMSNHYHLVLHVNQQAVLSLSHTEVIERWKQLYKLPLIAQKKLDNKEMSEEETRALEALVKKWRKRLYDISWFMRCLNEPIARRANQEDGCTGHFWQSRYKSQALLDDAAVLTCMTYVDLNPIRAKMAETPEESDYTSIQSRIRANEKQQSQCHPVKLQHFIDSEHREKEHGIQFSLHDYLELVDYTGRAIVENKRGYIPSHLTPILTRLGIEETNWLENVSQFERNFNLMVGTIKKLKKVALQLNQKWFKGISASKQLYKAPLS